MRSLRHIGTAAYVAIAVLALAATAWLRATYLWRVSFPPPLFYLALHIARIPQVIWPAVTALLLVVWVPSLPIGSPRIPLRSRVGLVVFAVLSVLDLWASFDYAVSYRGWLNVLGIVAATLLPLAALAGILWSGVQDPSFKRNLAFHFGVLLWLVTVGLPLLGELP